MPARTPAGSRPSPSLPASAAATASRTGTPPTPLPVPTPHFRFQRLLSPPPPTPPYPGLPRRLPHARIRGKRAAAPHPLGSGSGPRAPLSGPVRPGPDSALQASIRGLAPIPEPGFGGLAPPPACLCSSGPGLAPPPAKLRSPGPTPGLLSVTGPGFTAPGLGPPPAWLRSSGLATGLGPPRSPGLPPRPGCEAWARFRPGSGPSPLTSPPLPPLSPRRAEKRTNPGPPRESRRARALATSFSANPLPRDFAQPMSAEEGVKGGGFFRLRAARGRSERSYRRRKSPLVPLTNAIAADWLLGQREERRFPSRVKSRAAIGPRDERRMERAL